MNLFAQFWRQRNYRAAVVIAVVALLWLLSGLVFSGRLLPQTASKQLAANSTELLRVQARRLRVQPYTTQVRVNSRTEPNRSVQLRAELDGVIAAVPVSEGQTVESGEVICEIEAEDRPQRLARARAALRKAELDFAGAQKLKARKLQSDTGLAQQQVTLANARADLKRAQVEMENLKIRAPFTGLVNSRAVELGDFVRRGEACATLLDMNPILLVGEVSESQVGKLKPGGPAIGQLQQGTLVEGKLRFISQQANDITRAYRVEVAIDNTAGYLRGGTSAHLVLPGETVFAHLISSSLLALDDRGDLGVRIVDDEQRVQFVNVQLVSDMAGTTDQGEGVWVLGLPTPTTLITVGQEYVSVGEQVNVDLETDADELPTPAISTMVSSTAASTIPAAAVHHAGDGRESQADKPPAEIPPAELEGEKP